MHPNLLLVLCALLAVAPALRAEELVYSNTLGRTAIGYGAGTTVADDISFPRVDGCNLARFEFDVDGNTDGEGVGPFAVDFELYDDCPFSGGTIILGTQGHVDFGNNGRYTVKFTVPANISISLPRTVWLAVTFSRDHAGWVGGALPLVGYSQDTFYLTGLGCGFFFGGFPGAPHASFNARMYVRDGCPAAHAGYQAGAPRRGSFNPGLNVRMADDIAMDAPCQMAAFEVAVRGSGLYDFDLRTVGAGGVPGEVITGTARSVQNVGGQIRTLRQEFNPAIPLPANFWFTVSASSTLARTSIVNLPASAGSTQATFAQLTGTSWEIKPLPEGFINGAFEVTILCDGPAPLGACCDMHYLDESGEAVCREVAKANCAYPAPGRGDQPGWREGDTCSPDPFNPPCGTAACCLSDGTCENLTENECAPRGTSWTHGVYCDAPNLLCPDLCEQSDESCTLPHNSKGCIDPFCCAHVCSLPNQGFCCTVTWDAACAAQAIFDCGLVPANDECHGASPQDGARLVGPNSNTDADTINGTQNPSDPGFCCHTQTPGATGLGSVWFRFVASSTSARVRTCQSGGSATDALLQVFEAADNSSPEAACSTLRSIGCNDDAPNCSTGNLNSSICLRNLTMGRTYYVLVAAKNEEARGVYKLSVSPSCTDSQTPRCTCPSGDVRWVDPPTGVVDARRPLARNSADPQGISQFVVEAPLGSDQPACWPLCETVVAGQPNTVSAVTPLEYGQYRVTLVRPITPGAVTTLSLNGDAATRGVFAFHPANANADSASAPTDLLALIDTLNGIRFLPWDRYSGDVDHSGLVTPADILETIDLLNGVENLGTWNGTSRPDPAPCDETR